MKLIYKILITFFILALVFAQNIIYASMADYTDEQADNKQKQEHQEWQKEQEERIGKSSNNFLKSLSVKKYSITPDFDKQTINYEITEEITDNYVEITADTDDEKSSVSGVGKVQLKSGENNLKIDVKAENGTVRTYFIKMICTYTGVSEKDAEKKEKSAEAEIYDSKISQIQSEDAEQRANSSNSLIIAGGVICLFVIMAIFIKIRMGKNHGKSKRKH